MENSDKFLKYIKNPINKRAMHILYSANKIKHDRCTIYKDFVMSLLLLVFETYLGDEITNPEQQMKHFNWCWDKNLENFKFEGLEFKYNKTLNVYFREFIMDTFYLKPKDNYADLINRILSAWEVMFDYDAPKSKSDVDGFIDLYKLFEKSLIS